MTRPDPRNQFFVAIIMGDLDGLKAALPENPDALSWRSPAGYPPLHLAILNQRLDIAVWLVEQGADLKQKAEGETAEKLADRKGMLDRLHEAEKRQEECRNQAIAAFGDNMHKGLKKPIAVPKKLSLKRKGPF